MLEPGRFRRCVQWDTTVVPTSINTRATLDFKQIHCPLWCHSTRNSFTSLVLCVLGTEVKKNPQFSVSLVSRESGFCCMVIALDSWDIVCWELAFLLNEATGFYSMGYNYCLIKHSAIWYEAMNSVPKLYMFRVRIETTISIIQQCWWQWPRGLRRGTAAARLLGLRVRIPRGAWMSFSCECCVLWGGDLFDGPIALQKRRAAYGVSKWLWSRNLTEETKDHGGSRAMGEKLSSDKRATCLLE